MRIGITGTPGTGKTTALQKLDTPMEKIFLLQWAKEYYGTTDEITVDTDEMNSMLNHHRNAIFEGHLAHYLDLDTIIVFRCNPDILFSRLSARGYSHSKIRENMESEAVDQILIEAINMHGKDTVYEVDTSHLTISEVVMFVERVINNTVVPVHGIVDWSDVILGWY